MNDIPADAAPTTEEPAPPVPPGEPSSAAAAVSAAVAPGEDLLASGSPTEAPPPPTPNPQSTAGMDVTTNLVDCPPGLVGRVIGKGGETIKGLQAQSGAHITVDQNFPEGVPRKISISGPAGCVDIATKLVEDLLKGGPVRSGSVGPGQAQHLVECPKEMVGRVIGRGGETIKGLQSQTGARIQIDQTTSPCTVTITGNPYCVEAAARAVTDVINGGSTAPYSAANQHQLAAAAAAQLYGHHPGFGGHPGMHPGQFGGHPAAYGHMGAYGGFPGYPGGGYPGGYPQQFSPQQQQQAAAQQQFAAQQMLFAQAQAQAQAHAQAQAAQAQAQAAKAMGAQSPGAGGFPGFIEAALKGEGGAVPEGGERQAGGKPGEGGAAPAPPPVPAGVPAPRGAAGGAGPAPGGGAGAGGSEWQPMDDGRGRTYYYDSVTGVSTWEKPPQ